MGLSFLISIIYLVIFFYIYQINTEKKTTLTLSDEVNTKTQWLVIYILILFRLLLASFTPGYTSDMSCWSSWGEHLVDVGPGLFYVSDYFCDYPPGYLYILGGIAYLTRLLHLPSQGIIFFYKLPSVLCDFLLAYTIYHYGKNQTGEKSAFILSILFLISPVFWYDSAVWGQIDSVLLLFLVLTLTHLYHKKFIYATIFYAIAVLIKPQGLILAPIFALSVLNCKNIKTILLCALTGISLFLVAILPFSSAMEQGFHLTSLLQGLNPIWIIEKYANTLASYPYFSVNAFNLYGILQLNWVPLETMNSALVTVLNYSLILLALSGSVYLWFRIKDPASKLFLSGYFIFGFMYTFSFKMHERYIVLPLMFLLFDYLYTKNKRLLTIFSSLCVVAFLNLSYVLQLVLTTNKMPSPLLVTPISIAEVALFIYSLIVIYQDFLSSGHKSSERKDRLSCFSNIKKPFSPLSACKNMTRIDYILLSVIVVVYSLFAFTNLGDTKAPETFYQPSENNESFVITFQEPIMLTEIDYYCGISDVNNSPGIQFSYSDDNQLWTPLPEKSCVFESVFRWNTETVDPVYLKYLHGTFDSKDYTLYEVGFRDGNGNLATIESISGTTKEIASIVDEQQFVTDKPSYQNGTYFDEIYHARTAYEHLHLLPYYETTHPPLGKLIMSLGIAVFGMTPFGWRFAGSFMGVLMIPVFYFLLKRLFSQTRYAVMGTLIFTFDFMHYSLTRIATIDSFPLLFILCMYYFMYRFGELSVQWAEEHQNNRSKQLLYLLLSGVFMGLGCASKWTAVYASVGLAIEFLMIMIFTYRSLCDETKADFLGYTVKTCCWCCLFFIVIPAGIYTLSYLPISLVEGYGNLFETMWENQEYMLTYHTGITGTHPYSSEWYTWPFVYKPMWAYQAIESSLPLDKIGCISIFQNPFISWLGIISVFASLYIGWKKKDKRVPFLLVGMLSQYLPWIFVKRYALQYHFFGVLPFMIIFIVYALMQMERKWEHTRYISNGLVALSVIMFLSFYPVITGVPISKFYVETFLTWFESWVFFL